MYNIARKWTNSATRTPYQELRLSFADLVNFIRRVAADIVRGASEIIKTSNKMGMSSDLTFFTNEPDSSLLDRFQSTLSHVQYFDVLVGYFRTSGFHLLHEAFADIEKIRILVGLGVDRQAFEIIDAHQNSQRQMDFESSQKTKQYLNDQVAEEMANSPDTFETEIGVRKFIEFLQSGRLEIKAHPPK